MQDHGVGQGLGTPRGDVVIEDAVNDEWAYDAGSGPRGQETTVDGADVEAAEEVFEVRGYGGKAAAVHREQQASHSHKGRGGVQ